MSLLRSPKAQVAVEFLLLVSVMLVVFLLVTGFIASRNAELNKQQTQQTFDQVALQLETELRLASSTVIGYSRIFSLPVQIRGINYRIAYRVNALDEVTGFVVEGAGFHAAVQTPLHVKVVGSTGTSAQFRVETFSTGIQLTPPTAPVVQKV